MNKEQKVIDPNAVVVFDRDVTATELNSYRELLHGDVVIWGDLNVDTDLDISCNVYVIGMVEAVYQKTINIKGDLDCESSIDCYDIEVSGSIWCDGVINSKDIRVGENLYCEMDIQAMDSNVIVVGELECFRIDANEIYILNKLRVKEAIEADIVEVG